MSAVRRAFDALEGAWIIRRQLKSDISAYPTGFLQGTANFYKRPSTAVAFDAEYLYVEEGELETDSGFKMQASRKYVYRYHSQRDQISTWFVQDDDSTVDYLFNELQPEFSNNADSEVLILKGDHPCVNDMYYASYRFQSLGDNMIFSVIYQVQGPKKDYSHDTLYTRS